MISRTASRKLASSKLASSACSSFVSKKRQINTPSPSSAYQVTNQTPNIQIPRALIQGTVKRHNSSQNNLISNNSLKNPLKKSEIRNLSPNRKFSCRPLNTEVMIRERRSLQWFYDHPMIDAAAKKTSVRITPATILYTGTSCDHAHILKSAQFLRKELPVRVAHWVNRFRSLPFIVGCNPIILGVHELYIRTFYLLSEFPEVNIFSRNFRIFKIFPPCPDHRRRDGETICSINQTVTG